MLTLTLVCFIGSFFSLLTGGDAPKLQYALSTVLTEEDSRTARGDAASARFRAEPLGDVIFDRFSQLHESFVYLYRMSEHAFFGKNRIFSDVPNLAH